MPKLLPFRSYFEGADPKDPMVSPAYHPEVLAKFPPTLFITATRAPDLSPAAYTHSQLVKAGVPGDLIVGEGLGHCYIYTSSLPEAQDAYGVIVNFFRKNLK
jgi:acetyl esterase/lipase